MQSFDTDSCFPSACMPWILRRRTFISSSSLEPSSTLVSVFFSEKMPFFFILLEDTTVLCKLLRCEESLLTGISLEMGQRATSVELGTLSRVHSITKFDSARTYVHLLDFVFAVMLTWDFPAIQGSFKKFTVRCIFLSFLFARWQKSWELRENVHNIWRWLTIPVNNFSLYQQKTSERYAVCSGRNRFLWNKEKRISSRDSLEEMLLCRSTILSLLRHQKHFVRDLSSLSTFNVQRSRKISIIKLCYEWWTIESQIFSRQVMERNENTTWVDEYRNFQKLG